MTDACWAEHLNPERAIWLARTTESGQGDGVSALTSRMTRGDETAFQEFFNSYFHRLLRYLLVVTHGREEEAREALQSTLLRVVKHIRHFESEAAIWGWLTVLARSAAVDEQRKRRRYAGLISRFFENNPRDPTATQSEAESELVSALHTELAALSPDERELLARKYEAAESVRDLATALEITEKAVESRLTRVRQKLRAAVLARLRRDE